MRFNVLISCLLYLTTTAKLYAGIDTTQIPIFAWGGVPPEETSIARYEEMKNAGITISLTRSTTIDSMTMMLDMAEKAGVQLIVRCPELQTDPESTVRRFMDHPATAGYFLKDEPSASAFKSLGTWANRIRSIDSQRFCYLNLLPNYAIPAQLGTATYRQHVQEFINNFPASFVSFDHYPVIENKGQRSLRKEWFENLEIIAGESQKAGKPFFAFAMSVAHGLYPIPTLPELRLQVYSNLAYGAQGIQYFTYWTPKNKSQYAYHHGPIDDNKKRTAVYDMLKTLNAEIQHLSAIFLSSKVISVEHIGKDIPDGTQRLAKLPEGVKKISIKGEGAIVSVLENAGDRFIVIVNKDFVNPMRLSIKSGNTIEKVSKNGTVLHTRKRSSSVAIGAGDIAVYRLNNINESSFK